MSTLTTMLLNCSRIINCSILIAVVSIVSSNLINKHTLFPSFVFIKSNGIKNNNTGMLSSSLYCIENNIEDSNQVYIFTTAYILVHTINRPRRPSFKRLEGITLSSDQSSKLNEERYQAHRYQSQQIQLWKQTGHPNQYIRIRNRCSSLFALSSKTTTDTVFTRETFISRPNISNIKANTTTTLTTKNNFFKDERYDIIITNNDTLSYNTTKRMYRPVDNYTIYTNRRLDLANSYPTIPSQMVRLSSSLSPMLTDSTINLQSSNKTESITSKTINRIITSKAAPILTIKDLNSMVQYLSSISSSREEKQLSQKQRKQEPHDASSILDNDLYQERIQNFVYQLQHHGGYVLLDLHDMDHEDIEMERNEKKNKFDESIPSFTSTTGANTSYSNIIAKLWNSVEKFYSAYDYGYPLAHSMIRQITRSNTEIGKTRHQQVQQHPNTERNTNRGGYKFLQISYNQYISQNSNEILSSSTEVEEKLNPPNLQAAMGTAGSTNVLNAIDLLTRIGQSFATIALTSIFNSSNVTSSISKYSDHPVADNCKTMDRDQATNRMTTDTIQRRKEEVQSLYSNVSNLVRSLLHNEPGVNTTQGKYSGTYHRLARYIAMSHNKIDQTNNNTDELLNDCKTTGGSIPNNTVDNSALQSHTDWTVVTIIPVSAIAGLEVFDPSMERWVRVEEIAHQHFVDSHYDDHTSGKDDDRENYDWNSNYCIVLTGKLIELLSSGTIPSCIHRVIMNNHSNNDANNTYTEQRLSVPLFMRPKESIFTMLDQLRYTSRCMDNSRDLITSETEGRAFESHHDFTTPVVTANDSYTLQYLRKEILQFVDC